MSSCAQCYVTAVPWLVFTNVYVALCGAALTASSYALLGSPIRFNAVTGLVFCSTLVIYNLDRLVEPSPGDSEHEQWVASHRGLLWGITAVCAASLIAFSLRLSMAALLSLPNAGAVAIGYCLPVLRYRGQWIRLKAVPGAKLILIALVWTYATAGLPMLDCGAGFDTSAAAILVARFFFIAAVALPFDVPDMQRDLRSGIATLPIMLGVDQTRLVAFVLIAISALFSMFITWPVASALLLSCACVAGLIAMLRPHRGVLYFMVALDGTLLIQAGLLWLSTA